MGVSALRYAACAGVLLGALMLGDSTVGVAFADPGGGDQGRSEEQTSKEVNNDRAGLAHLIQRILGEHRTRVRHELHSAPRAKFGSDPDSKTAAANETTVTTFAEADPAPAPDIAPTGEREADPDQGVSTDGTDTDGSGGEAQPAAAPDTGGGSDYQDNVAVAATSEPQPTPAGYFGYPYPYYLWELRLRGGGDWWNVNRVVSSLQQVISPFVPTPPKPEPEPKPEQVIGPAFRGGGPEPEPVLDASGGVTEGGGGGYVATGFGGAPVLTAPIIAMPAPPPAAARFPTFPAAATPAPPGVGSAVARVPGVEPGTFVRSTVPQQQAPADTVRAMSGQTLRQSGYTNYLRSPGLPQLAGAALPGVAGIVLMTLAGGVLGYRQASAGRMIRSSAAARYLP